MTGRFRRVLVATCLALALARTARGTDAGARSPAPRRLRVTFNQDIAPLLHTHCAQCHRPGGAGPFSLLTFADARRRAATTGGGDGERLHAAVEGRRASGRVRGPAAPHRRRRRPHRPLGRGADRGARPAPVPPRWPEGWYLGEPDLIVTLPAGYTVPGEPSDVFRIFAVPLPVTGTRYVRGIEFHPGNARVVHHANIRIDRSDGSRRLDDADRGAGLRRSAGPLGGVSRRPLPRLDAGADRAAGRRRPGLASRSRHRPGRPAPHAAERQAARPCARRSASTSAIGRRPARRRSSGSDRRASTSHPARAATWSRTATRCRWTPRCSPCSRTPTTGPPTSPARPRSPTATQPHAHPHRRLGLPLAARLPLCRADPAPARDHGRDALRLRQLAAESAQPAAAAGPRPLGPTLGRRDGRPVVPARHRQRRRPDAAARRGRRRR